MCLFCPLWLHPWRLAIPGGIKAGYYHNVNEKPRFWYVHSRRGFFAWLMLSVDCPFHTVCMSCFHCEKRDATHPDGTATAQNAIRKPFIPNYEMQHKANLISFRFHFKPSNENTNKHEMIPDWRAWYLVIIRKMMDVSHFYSYCFCSSSIVPGVWIGRFKPGMLSEVLTTFRYQTYCWTSYCAFLYVFIKFVSGFLWWVRPE